MEKRRAGLSRFCTEAASSSASQGWNEVFLLSCHLATTPALPTCISHLPQRAETVPGNPALRRAYKWPWTICGYLGYTLLQPFWNQNILKWKTLSWLPWAPWGVCTLKIWAEESFPLQELPQGLWVPAHSGPGRFHSPPRDSATPPRGERSFLGSWRDGWRDAPDWAAK